MTTSLTLPSNLSTTDPAPPFKIRNYVFDHIPGLGELLPKHRGRPGFEYLQCCVTNLRRAQDEGWTEVENTMIYVIEGPKGEAHMKLLARGKLIPGQPTDSGARLCLCDTVVQDLTGLWINPQNHLEEDLENSGPEDGGDTPAGVEEKQESGDS